MGAEGFLGNLSDKILLYCVLLFSICCHECAHAFAADRCGDPTARLMGRVSLNPKVHIDPVGTVILPLFMMLTGVRFLFGWAKPVPVNPLNFRHFRRDEIIVSLAGIGANLTVALTAAFAFRALTFVMGVAVPGAVYTMLYYLMALNVILAFFNLIPIPPLDGSHVLAQALDFETRQKYMRIGPMVGFILIILFVQTPFFWTIMRIPLSIVFMIAGIPGIV